MELRPVSSTSIAAVGYDREAKVLGIRFQSGEEYHYHAVGESIFDGLLGASSVGRYFDQFVRKAGYKYERIG